MKKNKNILVTGGAGFIGSHLVARLLQDKAGKVIVFDDFNDFYDPRLKQKNLAELKQNENFVQVKGDITNKKNVDKLFADNQIGLVYHLAARAGVRPSIKQPELYEKVNIQGTLNLLAAATKANVEKFIFASSSSVYGNNPKTPFSEKDNVDNPISPYAATKKAGELLCYTYHHLYKLPVACLRFFTVYGPRQRPEMAIHKFIKAIDQGQEIEMYGDGSTRRDYTYIEDIVNGLINVSKIDLDYQIYNLGNFQPVALRDLIDTISQKLGKKAKIKQLPIQPGDVNITYADVSKAKQAFGYEPKTKIDQGIAQTVNWYLGKTKW